MQMKLFASTSIPERQSSFRFYREGGRRLQQFSAKIHKEGY